MNLAIISDDGVSGEVLAFAAERRGHQAHVVDRFERLFERLPFTPSIVVVPVRDDDPAVITKLARVRAAFPHAGVFVTAERPREPLATRWIEAGAREVIRQPYNQNELVLKAEAWAAARTAAPAEEQTLKLADLEMALDRYLATKNGKVMPLTKLEMRLLYCLCEHYPHVAPLERLLTFGWDTLGDPDGSLLKTHMSHIRRKLRDAGGVPLEIVSRHTVGYIIQDIPA
jgi:DNA-binding response OmpR family regulator